MTLVQNCLLLLFVCAVATAALTPGRCYPADNWTTTRCVGSPRLPRKITKGATRLDMAASGLTTLSDAADVLGAEHLVQLDFSANNISHIGARDLCPFTQVEDIDVSGNRLVTVDADSFQCLDSLISLDMSDNPGLRVYQIHSRSLAQLRVDRCDLVDIDLDLDLLPSLRLLSAKGNPRLDCSLLRDKLRRHNLVVLCDPPPPYTDDSAISLQSALLILLTIVTLLLLAERALTWYLTRPPVGSVQQGKIGGVSEEDGLHPGGGDIA